MAGLVTMAIAISAAENRPSLLICDSCDVTKTFGREPHRAHQLIQPLYRGLIGPIPVYAEIPSESVGCFKGPEKPKRHALGSERYPLLRPLKADAVAGQLDRPGRGRPYDRAS